MAGPRARAATGLGLAVSRGGDAHLHRPTIAIDGPGPAPGPRVVDGFMNETCGVYARLGIDQRFWWCN